ncbi:MAG: phosphoribosylformylglycinamidine cyclo-ligase [Bryobacteraceae bacterium]|nr:phosphoribosylformylglycinamidine cyclo-ligase [Bryobacteraceae bacterium]
MKPSAVPIRYADSGVDIDEADRAVRQIRNYARATFTKNVLTDIGSFGGGFALTGYRQPVLVSSADGVGTKLKVAILANRHDTIGEDLVNHCVNDIAVQGARPLFFLDYFACGKLDHRVAAAVVKGLARGCKANGCALVGGETAEMPGFYDFGDYDVAGFIVGAVERKKMLTGEGIRAGDILLGFPSNGLHTNGYSLARKLLFEVAGYKFDTHVPEIGATVADELLRVHKSYLKPLAALMDAGLLKGAAHITGGGITDNTPRILPKGLGADVVAGSWPVPPIFAVLKTIGQTPDDDWLRTFNCGIGMIAVVAEKNREKALAALKKVRQASHEIGAVVPRKSGARVRYV